jgi:hypothetical protein
MSAMPSASINRTPRRSGFELMPKSGFAFGPHTYVESVIGVQITVSSMCQTRIPWPGRRKSYS